MPNNATDLRSKALTSLLVLGGNLSEYGRLTVADIIVKEEYIIVNIRNSKTAHRTRSLYLFENMPHVVNWIQCHPLRDSKEWPDVPLFIGSYGKKMKPMSYATLQDIIRRVARKTDSSLPNNSHIFRNSIAFWKHKNGYKDLELCKSMGWALNSGMKARYIRCSDKRVLEEEMLIHGLERKEEQQKDAVIRCARCQAKYVNHNMEKQPHCVRCGLLLDERIRIKDMEQKTNELAILQKRMALMEGILLKIDNRLAEPKLSGARKKQVVQRFVQMAR